MARKICRSFLVFTVGGLEYFLFDTLSTTPIDVEQFHVRFLVISIYGALGYIYTLWRVTSDLRLSEVEKSIVKKTQATNILVASAISAISISVLVSIHIMQTPFSAHVFNFIGICYSVILIINIHLSLHMAFNKEVKEALNTEDSAKVEIPRPCLEDELTQPIIAKPIQITLILLLLIPIIRLIRNKPRLP